MTVKELKTELDRVSSRVSTMRDDIALIQNDFQNFKSNVTKDLKNIVQFLGKKGK